MMEDESESGVVEMELRSEQRREHELVAVVEDGNDRRSRLTTLRNILSDSDNDNNNDNDSYTDNDYYNDIDNNIDSKTTRSPSMGTRKIWVKRPGASATMVTIAEDHLVDDVRDMILKKYANTLGRNFDSPDVSLRVIPRDNRQERALSPEEPICQVLDGYFPGGQTVDEALVIDVPLRRTPRPSPQPVARYYQEEERRPPEAASEYFPPMPAPSVPSPHLPGMRPDMAHARSHSPSHVSLAFNVRSHYGARS